MKRENNFFGKKVKNLMNLGIELNLACKLALLDFLCIYNSQDMSKNLPLNELWYTRADAREIEMKRVVDSTWK